MRRLPSGPYPGLRKKHIKMLEKNLEAARNAYQVFVDRQDFDSRGAIKARLRLSEAYNALRKAKGI